MQGIIAGGTPAVLTAQESAEYNRHLGIADLKERCLTDKDVIVGLAASGRTSYVLGAVEYASSIEAATIDITSSADAPLLSLLDIALLAEVEP